MNAGIHGKNRDRSNTARRKLLIVFRVHPLMFESALRGKTTFPGQIGVEAAERPTGFIDVFKNQGRPFQGHSDNPVPTDAIGNPLSRTASR